MFLRQSLRHLSHYNIISTKLLNRIYNSIIKLHFPAFINDKLHSVKHPLNKMTEKSLRTVNLNILGFKVPINTAIRSGDEEPVVPHWLKSNKMVEGLAYLGQDYLEVEEQVLRYE